MTELSVIDLEEALLVVTTRRPSRAEGLLSATATAGITAIIAWTFVGGPTAILLAVLSAAIAFMYSTRVKRFELRMTGSEFASRGRVGDNFGSTRSVRTCDVEWLEYQEDTSGPETSHHPGGLYAVLKIRNLCLLPDVDEEQAAKVIERIEDRFPELRRRWRGRSSFGEHFTSLDLNEPT